LLPCILFEKYIYFLALEMASPGNQQCANCIGTLSFPFAAERRRRLQKISIVSWYARRLQLSIDPRPYSTANRPLAAAAVD